MTAMLVPPDHLYLCAVCGLPMRICGDVWVRLDERGWCRDLLHRDCVPNGMPIVAAVKRHPNAEEET